MRKGKEPEYHIVEPSRGFVNQPGGMFWASVLSVALIGQIGGVYFIEEPTLRTGVFIVLLAPLVLSLMKLVQLDKIAMEAAMPRAPRQFKELRRRTVGMVDEIKRLNWLAVDASNGVRNRDEIEVEMDVIEGRLQEMVGEIRQAAGRME